MECKQTEPKKDPVLFDIYRKNQNILHIANEIEETIKEIHATLDVDVYGSQKAKCSPDCDSAPTPEPIIKFRFDCPQLCDTTEEILIRCQKSLTELLHKIVE